ncbi:uncharacterized protein LOC100574911 [Acyrthosiphon pisum]|uniref:Uncharacterized protein n=1 Tax=Acyrthosiphon pisum TaxID=7029 RepID=A0A8R2F6K3_ACYPI|nr:uncharacterized protein LOC100574911 [Acyrthosiphon pisum]|eukprot:XP_008180893.1 PREDICTED: uncharacterized protein LOC100574911 [Acyrthosiphon pisum]
MDTSDYDPFKSDDLSSMTPQQIKHTILGSEIITETTLGDGSTVLPTPDGTGEWRVLVFNENNRGVRHAVQNISLLEIMKKYCDKYGLPIEKVIFRFDGMSIGVTRDV